MKDGTLLDFVGAHGRPTGLSVDGARRLAAAINVALHPVPAFVAVIASAVLFSSGPRGVC